MGFGEGEVVRGRGWGLIRLDLILSRICFWIFSGRVLGRIWVYCGSVSDMS